jgi:outer membrane protein assembly factor BamB
MYGHDVKHTGKSPFSTNNVNGGEIWRYFSLASGIDEGPVIDENGTIYIVGDRNRIHAISPEGEWLWDTGTGGFISGSTPAIADDGTIYVGSWDHRLYAINPDGSKKWEFLSYVTIASSPAIAEDGTIYFGNMGYQDNGWRIYAVNPDGTLKWFYQTDGDILADPAIGDDDTIYIGSCDSFFYAINPDGTLKWKYETDDVIKAGASIAEDGTIYVRSWDDYLYAFNPDDGSVIWKTELYSGYDGCPAIGGDGTIYMGGHERIYALNPDGSIKWETFIGSDKYVHKSSIALSLEDNLYVGLCHADYNQGEIISLNKNGNILWRKTIANKQVQSSPAIGSDGTVYIGSDLSKIIVEHYGILYAIKDGIFNQPPSKPIISGEDRGEIGEEYEYKFKSTDPEGEDIYYFVLIGNRHYDVYGPFPSGEEASISYYWDPDYHNPDTYYIKAFARDEFGMESEISTLELTIPKNNIKVKIIDWLKERFPLLNLLFNLINKPIEDNDDEIMNNDKIDYYKHIHPDDIVSRNDMDNLIKYRYDE